LPRQLNHGQFPGTLPEQKVIRLFFRTDLTLPPEFDCSKLRMIYEIDAILTHWVNSWSGHSWMPDTFLVWLSSFGVLIMVLGVAGQWQVSKDRQHTRHILFAAGFSFLFGPALNQVILLFVHRVRPYPI
jgi:hypothetical protein